MKKNLHEIDELFRQAIDQHSEMPDKEVWDAIYSNLNKNEIKHAGRKYTGLKRVAVFFLLLFLCIAIYDSGIKHVNHGTAKAGKPGGEKAVSKNNSVNGQHIIPQNGAGNSSETSTAETKKITVDDRTQMEKIPVAGKSITENKNHLQEPIMQGENITVRNRKQLEKKIWITNKEQDQNPVINSDWKNIQVANNEVADKKHGRQTTIYPFLAAGAKNSSMDISSLEKLLQSTPIIVVNENISRKNNGGKSSSRFSATVFFSPDIASYRITDDQPGVGEDEDDIRKGESPDLSSTTGAWIDYKLGEHWALQSGISFSNAIIVINPKIIYAEQDNVGNVKYRYNSSSGYGYVLPKFSNPNIGDSLYAFAATHTLQYVGIPLGVKYNFSTGRFSFFAGAGVSANILVKGTIETLVENGTNNENELMNKLEGLKKIYFSGSVNIGAEYKLSDKFSLQVTPVKRFALNSINNKTPIKSYQQSFGFAAGIRMNF